MFNHLVTFLSLQFDHCLITETVGGELLRGEKDGRGREVSGGERGEERTGRKTSEPLFQREPSLEQGRDKRWGGGRRTPA